MDAPLHEQPSPSPSPGGGQSEVRALLERVRAGQRRLWWLRGGLGASAALLVSGALALILAAQSLPLARAALGGGLLLAAGLLWWFGVRRSRADVGDHAATARFLSTRAPELDLDLLAAVELSRALGERHDFSPALAQAFVRQVGLRARAASAEALLDRKPVRQMTWVLLAAVLASTVALGLFRARAAKGLARLLAPTAEAARIREPITGDVTLTYLPPAYTGLGPRTVEGTRGDVRALPGTEVQLSTRADRDVKKAVLVVNGQRSPLEVEGRTLKGHFVVGEAGAWHVAFLEGTQVVAEGPELPITVDADQDPQVRLTAPVETLEVDPQAPAVQLGWDAKDDFGLQSLTLVYRPPGQEPRRLELRKEEGRSSQGRAPWDLSALQLKPGQKVEYFLEAKDTDTVKGPKTGVSRTQVLTIYSAAEHRRAALDQAMKVWERLVGHLADRMESKDRGPPPPKAIGEGASLDERGLALASETIALGKDLAREKDAPQELAAALANAGTTLDRAVGALQASRRIAEELSRHPDSKNSVSLNRLAAFARAEVDSTERSVLYLESLLDRQKLAALKEVAEELRQDRRELARLLEQYRDTKSPEAQAKLLEQMQQLRARMAELAQRMSALAKGINDEHLNREALQEMMDEQNLSSALDEMEKLIKEGKTDEAMKKMQELSMEMDQMLQNLDRAEQEADQQADPELAKAFEEFQQKLDQTTQAQSELEQKAAGLDEAARKAAQQRIQQQGDKLKAQLLEQVKQLRQGYQAAESSAFGMQFERPRESALQQLNHVEQALQAGDFDLAAEAARELVEQADNVSSGAERQKELDERFQNPPSVRAESRAFAEKMQQQEKNARKLEQELESLFPKDAAQTPEQQAALKKLQQGQRQLERDGEALQQKLDELSQKAPVFGPEAQGQLGQASRRMGEAARGFDGRDVRGGHQAQKGALQALQALQQQLKESQKGRGGKKGLPMPMGGPGGRGQGGSGQRSEKVELPPEDTTPRELRQDVMDAMKQGAPDGYKDSNRKYYEELVK